MNKSFRVAAAVLLAVIFTPAGALAQHSDYLPLTKAELGKRFLLKPLGEIYREAFPKKVDVGASGADVRADEESGDLTIEGNDRAGKKWGVQPGVRAMGLGGWMYAGDIDKNGFDDLAFVVYTGGNGLAPSSHFITVMFDDSGRPTYFEADGYFDPQENGFQDLVDMDGDGRAELVYMNYDDGYWITNVYKAGNARWEQVKGRFKGRAFPLYTRFTNRPNRKAVIPARGRRPFAPNLSTATPLETGQLLSYHWHEDGESEEVSLTIKTASGKTQKCSPRSWRSSFAVVIDNELGRNIIAFGAPAETIKSRLKEIGESRYNIRLFGQRKSNSCSPEIVWASPSR